MRKEANYFKLGVFVICATFLILAGVFYLGVRELFRDEWLVETYLDHTVEGLSVGSPVKMMGVKIGTVKKIEFVHQRYQTDFNYVYVLFSVDPSAVGVRHPEMEGEELARAFREEVDRGLRITLSLQGITGIAFLDAAYYEPGKIAPLVVDWEPDHPYVPSVPGTLARLGSALERSLENIAELDFAAAGEQLEQTLKATRDLLEREINPLFADIKTEITPALANFREGSERIPEISARLQLTLRMLQDLSREEKGNLVALTENLMEMTNNLRQLTETARRYPSQIFFGDPPPRSGEVEQR